MSECEARPTLGANLAPGMELAGSLVRETPGEWLDLPAVVARCRPEMHDGETQMHVWWTFGGDCFYRLDATLLILEATP